MAVADGRREKVRAVKLSSDRGDVTEAREVDGDSRPSLRSRGLGSRSLSLSLSFSRSRSLNGFSRSRSFLEPREGRVFGRSSVATRRHTQVRGQEG